MRVDPPFGSAYPRYPQSPKAFLFKNNETVIGYPELLSIFIFAGLPPPRPCSGLIQSEFPSVVTVEVVVKVATSVAVAVDVSVITATGVLVGIGVCVKVAVEG